VILRRRGRIVVLQGIAFTPMLAAAAALGRAALEAEAELDKRRQHAAWVSELKRQLRNSIAAQEESGAAARGGAVLDVGTNGTLSLRELAALATRLEVAARLLADAEDPPDGRILFTDRGDEIVRPYTTEKDEISVCKTAAPAASGDGAPEALRHITSTCWRQRSRSTGTSASRRADR
jgi:hypothetical protein